MDKKPQIYAKVRKNMDCVTQITIEKFVINCNPASLKFSVENLSNKRANKILDNFMTLQDKALQLIDHSFLSEKMKRNYLRIVNERISRFTRKSE